MTLKCASLKAIIPETKKVAMCSKAPYALLIVLVFFASCNNEHTRQSQSIVAFTSDSLSFDNILNKDISIFVQDENVMSFNESQNSSISISLLDIARQCKDKNEVALQALKSNNTLQIKVVIENEIDTIYKYNIFPYYDADVAFSISGSCAPLISKFSNPTQLVDIKKWLFMRKEYLNDEEISLLAGLVNQLSKTNTIEYVTNSTMPVICGATPLKYNVSSSIVSDYYILYACTAAEEIEEFVADVISNNFASCSKTLDGAMNCWQNDRTSGYKCICLVAINNDWSYKIQPLGLIAVDNAPPAFNPSLDEDNVSSIEFPNNVTVVLPSSKPQINGYCDVSIINSDGNGVECNVSFRVVFAGDVKSVTVKRTKRLSYPLVHKVENKVVDLTDKMSPYTFTYMLHLSDGDNYIPIIIEDNHGNKREFELNSRVQSVRRGAPSVNIDNNININP